MVTMSSSAMTSQQPRRRKRAHNNIIDPLSIATAVLLLVVLASLAMPTFDGTPRLASGRRRLSSIEPPVVCSAELDLHCPPSTKCCPRYGVAETSVGRNLNHPSFTNPRIIVGYTCLGPSKAKHPIGECCDDGVTGCSVGYSCDNSAADACRRTSDTPLDEEGSPIEFHYEAMPRYHNCRAMKYQDVSQPYGLVVADEDGHDIGQLAYYSNGRKIDGESDARVKTVIITVHGSSRNAANYQCFMTRAVQDHVASSSGDEAEYAVIAPWFLAPSDGEPSETSAPLPFLRWDDETPIAHTFRYGAESLQINGRTVSSFHAMDALLETLCEKNAYPNLESIVIAGHSAGGQFVHRWGISSDTACVDDDGPHVKLIAANPRSFAYLDGRRYFPASEVVDGDISHDPSFILDADEGGETVLELRDLNTQERDQCPEFDSYEWGLRENPSIPAPYVMSHLDSMENTEVFCRYASRDVTYLSGERDVENVGNQICHEDGYQGPSRRRRSERFYSSLQVLGREANCEEREVSSMSRIHDRVVVKDVGHDHALIYVAREGQRVLFW